MQNLFKEDTISVDLQARDKGQVIDEMIRLLAGAGVLTDAAAY